MTFFQYLRDHLALIFLFTVGLLVFCVGIWLDASRAIALTTLLYYGGLVLIAAAIVLYWRYRQENRIFNALRQRLNSNDDLLDQPLGDLPGRRGRLVRDSYNHLLHALQQERNKLMQQQQAQQDFIDSWVHEIKVPLAATALLRDSLEGAAPQDPLDDMALQLDKINYYVEQVLYYSRLESFSRDYLLQDYSLRTIVDGVVADQRNSFIARRISFKRPDDDATVTTDEKWLRFILVQIFSNALKYTPEGGRIDATITQDHEGAHLAIHDNGIGIPADERHRVFEKGFTGTNGRNANQQSTGLGLYLARALAEKLGHAIRLGDADEGTTVIIDFAMLDYFAEHGTTIQKPQIRSVPDKAER